MIKKIISGGQTGADQAGLEAAIILGIETGGWMPFKFRTDEGDRPDFKEKYGMREHTSWHYPPRTALNVKEADATIIFGNPDSPGSKLTYNLCLQYNKPVFINRWSTGDKLLNIMTFHDWIRDKIKPSILNVAGNRERSQPGIFMSCRIFIIAALAGL